MPRAATPASKPSFACTTAAKTWADAGSPCTAKRRGLFFERAEPAQQLGLIGVRAVTALVHDRRAHVEHVAEDAHRSARRAPSGCRACPGPWKPTNTIVAVGSGMWLCRWCRMRPPLAIPLDAMMIAGPVSALSALDSSVVTCTRDVGAAERPVRRVDERLVRVGKAREQRVDLDRHRAVDVHRRARDLRMLRLQQPDRVQDVLRALDRERRDHDRAAARDAGQQRLLEVAERVGRMRCGRRRSTRTR